MNTKEKEYRDLLILLMDAIGEDETGWPVVTIRDIDYHDNRCLAGDYLGQLLLDIKETLIENGDYDVKDIFNTDYDH